MSRRTEDSSIFSALDESAGPRGERVADLRPVSARKGDARRVMRLGKFRRPMWLAAIGIAVVVAGAAIAFVL